MSGTIVYGTERHATTVNIIVCPVHVNESLLTRALQLADDDEAVKIGATYRRKLSNSVLGKLSLQLGALSLSVGVGCELDVAEGSTFGAMLS